MIIYAIINKINQKRYIGQTIGKNFNYRYSGGRWWEITNNSALKNAFKKYGQESFEVEILEDGVVSLEELNRLEIFYAEKFNSYSPNGYNLRKCGDNQRLLPWQIEFLSNRNGCSKEYLLRKIDSWEIIKVKNLSKFCRDNGFKRSGFYNMVRKRDGVLQCNGYCLAETTETQLRDRNKRVNKGKVFRVISKDGEVIEFDDIKKFAEQNQTKESSLYRFLNGASSTYKGYRLLKESE